MLSITRQNALYGLWITLTLAATIYCAAMKSPGEMILCLATWAISTGMMSIMLLIFGRFSNAETHAA